MKVKLIECPRDAMQGLDTFIPTEMKIRYLNALLQVGFDTLDCGSFVSAKAIPQMADTANVISGLNMTDTRLSVIVANERGAREACNFDQITYLGFPFSISETFQKRNTNMEIRDALVTVENIHNLCNQHGKKFIAYISMGFGNPYNEPWSAKIASDWIGRLMQIGVSYYSLSDTVGVSNPKVIRELIGHLTKTYAGIQFGCHFHTRPDNWREKIETALEAGCRRFDGALKGFGGCPMANDSLVGNMPTENMAAYFDEKGLETGLDSEKLMEAMMLANEVFGLN